MFGLWSNVPRLKKATFYEILRAWNLNGSSETTPATENEKPDIVLYNEENRNVYSSPNIRVIQWRGRWAGHVACMGRRNSYKLLVAKPERRGLLGRPRCSWEGNVEMALTEMGWKGVEWIYW